MEEKVFHLLFVIEKDTINPIKLLIFQSILACLCLSFLLCIEWFKGCYLYTWKRQVNNKQQVHISNLRAPEARESWYSRGRYLEWICCCFFFKFQLKLLKIIKLISNIIFTNWPIIYFHCYFKNWSAILYYLHHFLAEKCLHMWPLTQCWTVQFTQGLCR